ncbi:MAG: DUF1573 domain-containing protein [Opitutaceae bacterium]
MKIFLLLLFSTLSAFGTGRFVFDESQVTLEADPAEDVVIAVFPFTVNGEGVATVQAINTACDCMSVSIGENDRRVWKSGERGFVSGVLEVGNFRGTQRKQILLNMEGGAQHKLIIEVSIPELVLIEPKSLQWEIGAERAPKTFRVTLSKDYPVEIDTIINSNLGAFDLQIETIAGERAYLVTITPLGTDASSLGTLRIATDSKQKRHKTYQAHMLVGQNGRVSKRQR